MNKISLQMYTMRDFTKTLSELDETVYKLKEIGFDMLQYSIPKTFDAKDVKKIFDEHKMKNDSVFCASLEIEERTNEILRQCELFETDYVRVDSMPPSLASTPAGYKMYAHYLNEAGAELKKHSKKLLYHFHAFEFIKFNDVTGIEIFLNETDPELVELIPDTHWVQAGGKNPTDFFEKYKNRYTYMHAKDFVVSPRSELLEDHAARFAPVGEGVLDWEGILKVCKANNVKSYAIEQDNCYGRCPFECVKSSFDFLEKMGVNK